MNVVAPSPLRKTDASAWSLVQRWREEPGLVFFDSALARDGGRSMVARRPAARFRGSTDSDWQELEAVWRKRAARASGALTDGFLAGWVTYEGAFDFGLYERVGIFEGVDPGTPPERRDQDAPAFAPDISEETYCAMVRRAQEYIAAGDIYQVNLAHRFEAQWKGDPLDYYAALRAASPAPHAAFLRTTCGAICSASPELFLDIQGRRIRTQPIKGTRPRALDPAADRRLSDALQASAKEAAELTMITDLERNDLGQVCEFGSVRVPSQLRLEAYRQVFHLVSTVEGTLREKVSPVRALRACFPGGSITGAPKIRAMQIIAELEGAARGLYTGGIGYFGFNGESQFNIAIRTAWAEAGRLHFHVGAGIVADSVPQLEYRETVDKAQGLLAAAKLLGK